MPQHIYEGRYIFALVATLTPTLTLTLTLTRHALHHNDVISTNSSRRFCHEVRGIVAVGRGVGVTELLVPRCPHADHDVFDAAAMYPGPALAHKRRRACLLPVSGTPLWEADWLVNPAVAHNLPAPNCGGP